MQNIFGGRVEVNAEGEVVSITGAFITSRGGLSARLEYWLWLLRQRKRRRLALKRRVVDGSRG